MITWSILKMPIKNLRDYEKNPREITKDQAQHLENLIKTYGLIDKPVINADGTIIGGHQRVRILKKMKVKFVECWVPDRELTEDEMEHLCIGMNLNQGRWDWDRLANEWDPLDLLQWGFTEAQLEGLNLEIEEKEKTTTTKKPKNCPNCGGAL